MGECYPYDERTLRPGELMGYCLIDTGYWEVPCQLCGVSFNIRRLRMKDEPRSAALNSGYRSGWVRGRHWYFDKEQQDYIRLERGDDVGEEEEDDEEHWQHAKAELPRPCSPSTGCAMVMRPGEGSWYNPEWRNKGNLYEDDPEEGILADDPSYEYQSDSDEEILEYHSEASAGDAMSETDDMGTDEDGQTEGAEWTFKVDGPDPLEFDMEFLPLDLPLGGPLMVQNPNGSFSTNKPIDEKAERLEHVGGPGCRNREAYIGKNISVEQMRGCHTVQGILWKKPGWKPRDDDLEFERGSQYFFTGIAEKMPASGSWLDCYPVRYGADDHVETETNFVLETSQEELRDIALPFHPACFELYIQATHYRHDRVDLDTLVQIRDKACIERRKFPVTYSKHVLDATAQWWEHRVGQEYLAANPVFIPGLRAFLESTISTDENFSVQNSAFEEKTSERPDVPSHDPFLALPPEIIQIIAECLKPHHLAHLRRSSRAFAQLPISFFRQRILKEMPWLYEAWSPDTRPYYWSTVVARDMIDEKRERESFIEEREKRRELINEYAREIKDELLADEPEYVPPRGPEWQEILDLAPIRLPWDKTNWYTVYWAIRTNWSSFPGLWNRRRIWKNVNQVVTAIRRGRKGRDFYLDAEGLPW